MLFLLLLPTLLPNILQSFELTTELPAVPDPPKTLQRSIKDCPSVGYFFERQDVPGHPGTCYLCYCKDDGLAGCTLRDSERCDGDDGSYQRDVEAVQQNDRQRRRTRRNPGLMDIFFNDEKKDLMLKSMARANEEDCKPKDSKSVGCPPKDWCKGCLVCDCDEKGEWQCHVMSFCEDKPPRAIAKKYKKTETKELFASENFGKKKTTTKTNKKTEKRSARPKKKNPKKASSTTTKKPTKTTKKPTTTTKKPTTTTKKPTTTTKKPQIAVKKLKKFIRKDQLKNGTTIQVIKVYISTVSPINSPELLKYKNDSRRLAQLLYKEYEASTKASHTAKREIKLEKILYMKQKRNFELKYNARGRKPMNVKENSDRNKKMKSKNTKRESENRNSFYVKQNALMNPGKIDEVEFQEDEKKEDTNIKGKYKRKEKVIYIPRQRRNKRDALATADISSHSTTMENETVYTSSVKGDQVSEPSAKLLRNEEETKSNLKNYEYTIDGTQTYNYDNGTLNNDTIYETTLKYADLITVETRYHDEENFTATNILNYTNVDNESTTKQQKYDSQALVFKNNTLSEVTDSLVSKLKLISNQIMETTTPIYYTSDVTTMSDKEFKDKELFDMENTTIKYYDTTIGWPLTEKLVINNITNETQQTPIKNNTNDIYIKKINITDTNMIITELNTLKLEKMIKSNETNITSIPKHTSMNRTLKSFKTDFAKMLHSLSNYNTKIKPHQNGMVAIKYLKKLYGQLLSNKNNKTRLNAIIVMESICDTFGPCKISTSKVRLINNKINELISEAKKALDVIKAIKDHFQLVDSKNNNTVDIDEEAEFKRYIKQLNAIITDNYETPLTETEMTNMNYVKNETKVFINSVANFAAVLNDILKIIHSEKIKYDNIRKRRKFIINRVTRHQLNNDRPLNKIKNLFLKFNLFQNTFMRNMYQAIIELEKANNKTQVEIDENKRDQRDKRYQSSVKKYMNKINYNLEKLKILALRMGAKQRRKRQSMRSDDAVEYLLTLMEYLLKHNNPVDKPPVADGIDLLIDAIRRAPDIKPIRKSTFKQMGLMPPSPYYKSSSKSSSESEEDNIKEVQEDLKENLSFEKPYSNDTLILKSNYDDLHMYKMPTSDVPHQSVTTTKYVDIEDMVFNGEVVQKVYMATGSPYESTDVLSVKQIKPLKQKKVKSKINQSASSAEDDTVIMTVKTYTEATAGIKNKTSTTETTIKTQFDRLNEEYEKEMKAKTTKKPNTKRKKSKRLRKKQKLDSKEAKSDVSSITKEVDEEKTRKKIVAEEALLRKRIIASDVDPFQSMDEESASREITALNTNKNEVFTSYFTK